MEKFLSFLNFSRSKSTVYADTLIDVGFSAAFDAMQTCGSFVDMTQSIVLSGHCTLKNIHHIKWLQKNKVNLTQLASIKGSADVAQKIESDIKATAKALAEGLGISDAETTVVTPTTIIATTAVKSAISSAIDNVIKMTQNFECKEEGSADDISYIDWEQDSYTEIKTVMNSDVVVTAKADIKQTLVDAGVSEAKGVNVWAVMLIVAIVVLGVPITAAKVASSPSFWFLLFTILAGIFGYVDLSPLIGTWPSDRINSKDSALEKKTKKEHNNSVLIIGSIGLGVSCLLAVLFGFKTFKK